MDNSFTFDRPLGEGSHHLVYPVSHEQVMKIPKEQSSICYTQAIKSQHFFDRFFPDFIPKNISIQRDSSFGYRAYQQRIHDLRFVSDILSTPDEERILRKLREFTLRAQFILEKYYMGFDIGGTSKSFHGAEDVFSGAGCEKLMQMTNFLVGSTVDEPHEVQLFFADTIVSSRSIQGFSGVMFLLSHKRRKELQKRKDYIFALLGEIDNRLKKIP